MKKRILCLVLTGLMVFMSLPLSALAEERQTEDKASSELITETPTIVENVENDNIAPSEEAFVSEKIKNALTEKDEKVEAEESKQTEGNPTDVENGENLNTEDLTFCSASDWSYSISSSTDQVTVTGYHGTEETITLPTELEGKKVVAISIYNGIPNTVKTMIVPEGIEQFDLYNAPGLENLSLPSTLLNTSLSISNTSLTSLDGLEKATKLTNLSVTSSKLMDISALDKLDQLIYLNLSNNPGLTDISVLGKLDHLKNLNLSNNPKLTDILALGMLSQLNNLNLSNNPELTDISALKNLKNLTNLYLKGAKVSEQDQLDLLTLPEEAVVSTGLSSAFAIGLKLDLELDATIKDASIAESTWENSYANKLSIKGLSAGKTEVIISARSNPEAQRSFPVTVNALELDQPVGDKVENLPQLEDSYTAMQSPRTETLGLFENGELWRIGGENQEKLLGNVKSYIGAKVYTALGSQSWALAQDKDDSLWVYETRGDGGTSVEMRLEHITKYGGMFHSGADNMERACAIDENQNLWQIDSNGGKDKLMTNVKDFAILHFYKMSKVVVLNTNNELYLGDMITKEFRKIADQVSELKQSFKGLDDSQVTTYIQNGSLWGIKKDYSTSQAGIAVYKIDDNASIAFGDFVVKSDGTTWYQKGDMNYQVLDKPIKEYGTSRNSEWTRKYEWLLDEDNILWRIERDPYSEKPLQIMPEKVTENVKNFYSSGSYSDNFRGYLLENGDYYNRNNEKTASNVLDIYDEYVLKRDHVVYLEETAILDHVSSLFRGKYYSVDGMIMIRDDGSLWISNNQGDATPHMIKDYIKEVPVTGIKLNQSTLMLTQGYTAQLQVTIEPENATNQKVSWTSSSPDIATVENGLVIGVKEGEAMITVTTEDGNKTAECKVTVKKAAPVLNPDSGTAEGIVSGETGRDFVDKLKENSIIGSKDQVSLFKVDGQEVSLDTKLATGMKVMITIGSKIFNRNAASTQEYTVVVLGDITGDGNINIMDMLAAQDDILGKEKLEGCYRTAADITGDNALNIMDMLAIQDDILGKEKINPYM